MFGTNRSIGVRTAARRSETTVTAIAPPRRRFVLTAGAASLALLAGACTDDSDWAAPTLGEPVAVVEPVEGAEDAGATAPPSWLFVLTAPRADVVIEDGTARLTLSDPDHVLAFTDRPARDAEFVRADWLAANWRGLFSDDPPNAVITGVGADGSTVELAVVVERLAGDGDELVATVVSLDDDVDQLPADISRVQLFVDDVIMPDQSNWSQHSSIVPNSPDRFVAGMKPTRPAGNGSLIYSFPAEALVANFRPQRQATTTTAPPG